MPAFDNNLMFRTTGAFTADETSSSLTIRGTGLKGLAARVVIPNAPGSTWTWSGGIRPEYWGSDNGTTWRLVAIYPGSGLMTAGGDGREIYTPIHTPTKYIYEFLNMVGTWTYGYGVVQSGLVQNVGQDWSRAVDWS